MMPKGWELVIILLVVLLLFGGKKIPEVAKGLGKGIREFKSALGGGGDAESDAAKLQAKPEVKSLPPDSQAPNS